MGVRMAFASHKGDLHLIHVLAHMKPHILTLTQLALQTVPVSHTRVDVEHSSKC